MFPCSKGHLVTAYLDTLMKRSRAKPNYDLSQLGSDSSLVNAYLVDEIFLAAVKSVISFSDAGFAVIVQQISNFM